MNASFLVKHGHKVIVINVISFVVYFGVSTLLGAYTTMDTVVASVVGFVAAIVVHEVLLIMNRPPPGDEPEALDQDEGADEDAS